MSYCRLSSDDFQCDVYVYGSTRGYETHVARRRHDLADRLPEPVEIPGRDDPNRGAAIEAWVKRHAVVMAMLDDAEHVEIGLPHDGDSFLDDTPGECADRLEHLRSLGYNVPRYAIDTLRREQAEDAEGPERSDPDRSG